MTIADIDVWRAADLLIKRHGEDAAIVAAQRADELLEVGDVEGQIVFKRIVEAINELQRQKPEPGEAVN
jgi:hypothetical protein